MYSYHYAIPLEEAVQQRFKVDVFTNVDAL